MTVHAQKDATITENQARMESLRTKGDTLFAEFERRREEYGVIQTAFKEREGQYKQAAEHQYAE